MANFKAPTSVSFYGNSGYYGGAKIKVVCPSGYPYIYASNSQTGGLGAKTATAISGTNTYTIDVAADTSSTGVKTVYIICSDTANLSDSQSASNNIRKSVSIPRFALTLYNGQSTSVIVSWSGGEETELYMYDFQKPPNNYITIGYTTISNWLGSFDAYTDYPDDVWGSIHENMGPNLNGKTLYGLCQKKESIDYYNCSSQKYSYEIDYCKYGQGNDIVEESGTYPNTSVCPKNSLYTFNGWATSSTSTTSRYDTIEEAMSTNASTVYAVYSKKGSLSPSGTATYYKGNIENTVKITKQTGTSYYYGKGTHSSGAINYTYGTPVSTLSGYTFLGWATDIDSYTSYYDNATTAWDNSTNNTIYGVYSISEAMTYYPQNGENVSTTSSVTNYLFGMGGNSGTTTNKPTEPVLTYTGYNFKGWASSTGDSASWASLWDSGVREVYALWEQILYYITVRYHMNNNTDSIFLSEDFDSENSIVTFDITNLVPTREKYNFLGWSLSSTNNFPDYASGETDIVYPGETELGNIVLDLYAIWKKNGNTYWRVDDEWKNCEIYKRVNGQWVLCTIHYGKNSWK